LSVCLAELLTEFRPNMLQSLSESLFGNNNGAASPAKSPRGGDSALTNISNVNTNPRGVKKASF